MSTDRSVNGKLSFGAGFIIDKERARPKAVSRKPENDAAWLAATLDDSFSKIDNELDIEYLKARLYPHERQLFEDLLSGISMKEALTAVSHRNNRSKKRALQTKKSLFKHLKIPRKNPVTITYLKGNQAQINRTKTKCKNGHDLIPENIFNSKSNRRDCKLCHRKQAPHNLDGGDINKLKTHCPKGHLYSGTNLIKRKDGRRSCKTCRAYYRWQNRDARNAKDRQRYKENKDARNSYLRKWYAENKEYRNSIARNRYLKNKQRAINSAVECVPYKDEVGGSNPSSPTKQEF